MGATHVVLRSDGEGQPESSGFAATYRGWAGAQNPEVSGCPDETVQVGQTLAAAAG
jgi:hypothetical protein